MLVSSSPSSVGENGDSQDRKRRHAAANQSNTFGGFGTFFFINI